VLHETISHAFRIGPDSDQLYTIKPGDAHYGTLIQGAYGRGRPSIPGLNPADTQALQKLLIPRTRKLCSVNFSVRLMQSRCPCPIWAVGLGRRRRAVVHDHIRRTHASWRNDPFEIWSTKRGDPNAEFSRVCHSRRRFLGDVLVVGQDYTEHPPRISRFTGKERDAETGLDYFGARYFSGAQGRFTSTDPILFSATRLADSQRWNLYAYTRNNPLRYVDPDGRDADVPNPARQGYQVQRDLRRIAPGTRIDTNGTVHKPGFFRRLWNDASGQRCRQCQT
jgi:RHS repeat-associated protein